MPSFVYRDSPSQASNDLTIAARASSGYIDADQTVTEAHENATYIPNRAQLWTSSGELILPSLLIRKGGAETWPKLPPPIIDMPRLQPVNQPVIWLGAVLKHYGHFIMESNSRIWAWLHDKISARYKILLYAEVGTIDDNESLYSEFFRLCGITRADILTLDVPSRLNEALIPHQSIYLEAECFKNQVLSTRLVANKICTTQTPLSKGPVFLSRSGVRGARRIIKNEPELEDVMRQVGLEIVKPEELSLSQQVKLWNTHRDFVGLWGSAFHSQQFSLRSTEQRTFLINNVLHPHYYALDEITGISGHYLRCVKDIGPKVDPLRQYEQSVDIDFVIQCLQAHNVV